MTTETPGELSPLPPGLPAERLRVAIDPAHIGYDRSDSVEPLAELVAQDRALEAIRFGAEVAGPGYNLCVIGAPGSGRRRALHRLLSERARQSPPPDDWVYVNNFEAEHRPRALRLPAGLPVPLRDAMRAMIEDLMIALPAAFEADAYKSRRSAIEDAHRERQEAMTAALQNRARQQGVAILQTPMGFAFAPVKDGEVVKPEVFKTWPAEERQRVQEAVAELQGALSEILTERGPALERELRERIRDLDRETATATIAVAVRAVSERFAACQPVQAHLVAVERDIVQNFHLFLAYSKAAAEAPEIARQTAPILRRYAVNVMDAVEPRGPGPADPPFAPVIEEIDPTYLNLIGRIEHEQRQGALVTDFTMIKPGALHRANGGYLIVDLRAVLSAPFAWAGLKRCLKSGTIRLSSVAEQLSLASTTSLEPDEIPLQVKVVLLAERELAWLAAALDPDFPLLFKVEADFEDAVDRSPETVGLMARLLATLARRQKLRPLDRGGAARVLRAASRLSDDAAKLTLRVEPLSDLLREADHLAGREGAEAITAAAVEAALEARRRRSGRLRERSLEAVTREILAIDTTGARVGQVNGLAVIGIGAMRFGRPARITARTRLGSGRIIDIEREVELGGPLHSKGVLILSSFLAARFGAAAPVSLSASLVFEQSYSGVDGDSASSAELYALLSSLAEVPLRQSLAVTGSVDQFGRVQAIGGVNEKIEGFFEVCAARGLTGGQGVLIPASNVQHLDLRDEVVEAVAAGRFAIHPVAHIDEGIALLTGLPAGEADAQGDFPTGSVNARAAARLAGFAETMRRFARPPGGDGTGRRDGDGEPKPLAP